MCEVFKSYIMTKMHAAEKSNVASVTMSAHLWYFEVVKRAKYRDSSIGQHLYTITLFSLLRARLGIFYWVVGITTACLSLSRSE